MNMHELHTDHTPHIKRTLFIFTVQVPFLREFEPSFTCTHASLLQVTSRCLSVARVSLFQCMLHVSRLHFHANNVVCISINYWRQKTVVVCIQSWLDNLSMESEQVAAPTQYSIAQSESATHWRTRMLCLLSDRMVCQAVQDAIFFDEKMPLSICEQ